MRSLSKILRKLAAVLSGLQLERSHIKFVQCATPCFSGFAMLRSDIGPVSVQTGILGFLCQRRAELGTRLVPGYGREEWLGWFLVLFPLPSLLMFSIPVLFAFPFFFRQRR